MYDDCDVLVSYGESIHRARKRLKHRCCECRQFVKPGERYASIRGLTAGEGWWNEVQHLRCYHFARHLNHEVKAFPVTSCVPFGEIDSAMHEFLDRQNDCGESYDDPLFLTWWFIQKGGEFKPATGSKMEASFKLEHPGKDL